MNSIADTPRPVGADELARLDALFALNILDTDPEPEFDTITRLAATCFDVPIAVISLVSADRQWFKSCVGLDARETPRDVSFCSHAITSDDLMVVPDARRDPRFCRNPLVIGPPYARFYAGAPLKLASGHRIGTLCLIDSTLRAPLDARQREMLTLLARQVVDLIDVRDLRRKQLISKMISDTSLDAFVCTDSDNRIIYWNRAAEVMFGWTAREALGRSLEMIIPQRHREGHLNGMRRVLGGAETRLVGKTTEVPACHRDGREFVVELSLGMWNSDAQGVQVGFASIIRDVSERKTLEAERDATRNLLAEQMAAIEASSDGIAITDAEGNFIFVNRSHAAIFGIGDPAQLIGRHWRCVYAPGEDARLYRLVRRQLEVGVPFSGRIVARRYGGEMIEQDISMAPRPSGGVVCVTRDVGSRLQDEREMTRLREQLLAAQRQEAIGQIASGIAHDFNNVIAAISGSAGLILAGADPIARQHAERVQRAAISASSLVQKMLSLGARKSDRAELDLARQITSVIELVRTSMPAGQDIRFTPPDTPILMVADSTELMQVLMNLAINARDALEATPNGCIDLQVECWNPGDPAPQPLVGSLPASPAARFDLADNGCGMSPDLLARIFQPFFSSKGSRGTGLGLSVVAGIVEAAGGGISVKSTPGEGSCFTIFWPLHPPAKSDASEPDVGLLQPGQLVGRAVLVVDDNGSIVELLTQLLEQAGAEVGPCLCAGDVLQAIRSDPDAWDLLVTDFDMPDMDGRQLARAARALKPDLPVLLCTGAPGPHLERHRHQPLFDAIIGKPATPDSVTAGALAALAARAHAAGSARPSADKMLPIG
jgi:PAS domain S-box-containing protein